MKKALIALAAMLAIVFGSLLAAPVALPRTERLEMSAVTGTDGLTYAVENGPLYTCIYGVSAEGDLKRYYREENDFGACAITYLSWSGKELFFLRESADPDGGVRWEAVRRGEDGGTEVLGNLRPDGYRATGFTAPTLVAAVATGGAGGAALFDAADGTRLLHSLPKNGFLALSAQYLGGEAMLLLLDDGRLVQWERAGLREVSERPWSPPFPTYIRVSPAMRLICKAPVLLAGLVAVTALWLLTATIGLLLSRGKQLAVRAAAVGCGSLLLALCLMSALLLRQFVDLQLSARMDETERVAEQFSAAVGQLEPEAVLRDDFYSSRNRAVVTGLLSEANAGLLALRAQSPCMVVSNCIPYGGQIPAEMGTLVESASAGTTAVSLVSIRGRWSVLCAAPVLSSGVPVAVVTVRADARDIAAAAARTISVLMYIGLACVAASCVAFLLLLRRVTRPLTQLTRQMNAVSDGDIKVRNICTGPDELGAMANAMQELCMSLSIREYEVQCTLDSYHRFIPRGLTALLDRASIMETGVGDSVTLTGVVGVLSVDNYRAMRSRLEGADVMTFVDRCFSAVERSTTDYGGYILSPGFNLEALQLYYPGKASSAVASGIQLLGGSRSEDEGGAPEFTLILHQTAVLYGLAGSRETLFPFLSSREMEFLTALTAPLAEAGAHLVLTQALLNELGPGYTTRYIGFVTAPETGANCKLYEVLDCYSDLERNLRVQYDDRFQEGIRLFYRNDFYLARNLFSALLRECPSDGVSRWYLFACEHYFSGDTPGMNAGYQLFGGRPLGGEFG